MKKTVIATGMMNTKIFWIVSDVRITGAELPQKWAIIVLATEPNTRHKTKAQAKREIFLPKVILGL